MNRHSFVEATTKMTAPNLPLEEAARSIGHALAQQENDILPHLPLPLYRVSFSACRGTTFSSSIAYFSGSLSAEAAISAGTKKAYDLYPSADGWRLVAITTDYLE